MQISIGSHSIQLSSRSIINQLIVYFKAMSQVGTR